MKIGPGTLGVIVAVALAAAALGYFAGTREQPPPATASAPAAVKSPVVPAAESTPAAASQSASSPAVQADPHASLPHGVLPGGPASPFNASSPAPNLPPPQAGRAHIAAGVDPQAKFTHFRVGQRNVKQIMSDGDLMWVGTSGGVIRYNLQTDEYRLFDLRSGLLANGIFHIGKLDDRIVVGTYGGGMAVYDDAADSWKNYNIPQGLGDAFIYDVLQTGTGDVWVATWSGANLVAGGQLDDRDKWQLFTVASTQGGLPNDWVYALAEGINGEVWFATEGGLARYHEGRWSNWNHEDGLGAPYELVKEQIQFANDPAQYSQHHSRQKQEMGLQDVDVAFNPNYIVALHVAADGSVWAGTWGGGLAHFDGRQWQNFTADDGLPGNHVFSLHGDGGGRLWVGTNNGLARFEGDGFRVYTVADGLFSNIVFSMETAPDGSAWVGSFGGVARIARLD
ncbi:MAG: regulator [Gammaproteobacteria bacterium]|nr:regulator [Gammaproteobacteria bacterium]